VHPSDLNRSREGVQVGLRPGFGSGYDLVHVAPTILVIDDVDATRSGLAELLRLKGFVVHEAANGEEGLRWLRADPQVRTVILDLLMPTANGYWFREQQLQDPDLAKIPVLVFTGAADTESARERLQVAEVMHKPVDLDHLLATLNRLV
jgi:CheY-like chemotaxis protein